jgi:hypothetical protein
LYNISGNFSKYTFEYQKAAATSGSGALSVVIFWSSFKGFVVERLKFLAIWKKLVDLVLFTTQSMLGFEHNDRNVLGPWYSQSEFSSK